MPTRLLVVKTCGECMHWETFSIVAEGVCHGVGPWNSFVPAKFTRKLQDGCERFNAATSLRWFWNDNDESWNLHQRNFRNEWASIGWIMREPLRGPSETHGARIQGCILKPIHYGTLSECCRRLIEVANGS